MAKCPSRRAAGPLPTVFTGLIKALGHLQPLAHDQLKISCRQGCAALLTNLELGDSVAVDGVCLTVDTLLVDGFIAVASPETLSRSTLSQLPDQALVNLEPSLKVGGKIGGHFVTGHVDGIGQLITAEVTAQAWEISFSIQSPTVARYIVPKGSIAVNGISLTIAECSDRGDWFKVAVIPVTYQETNLHRLQAGNAVNLEGDILGKYVEKFVQMGGPADAPPLTPDLSLNFLTEHGYL
jgi:riboflavin synthase